MLAHNYSQRAVVTDDGAFHGVISWETISKAHMSNPLVAIASQARADAPTAGFDEPLLPRIHEIAEGGFIFVWSRDRKSLAGIVTTADIAQRFRETAQPFTMIEECERRLRGPVKQQFTAAEIKTATNGRAKDADNMTIGNYVHLLDDATNFQRLTWPLDHRTFLEQLDEVRQVRNRLMHFSPDPVSNHDLAKINGLLAMLRVANPAI